MKLTDDQRTALESYVARREQVLAQVAQHFASQAASPLRTTRDDDPLDDDPLEDPVRKANWIQYWINRQFDSDVTKILTPQQAKRLDERLGERMAPADPWKLFADKHTIGNAIEHMLISIEKPLIHLDPPTKSEVFSSWAEEQRKRGRNVNQVLGDVDVIREKLVDFTTRTQHVETIGEGRLHIVIYLGTVIESDARTPLGRVYLCMARLYQAEG